MKSKIRHYAEEILRILDEEEAEIIEDEVPVEETEPIEEKPIEKPEEKEPVEEIEKPEPIEKKTTDPIRGFKAEIIAPGVIQCSWIPQADGEIDIEFYQTGINPKTGKRFDTDWKHSVNKYLKKLIPISDGSYRIWVREGDTGEGYLFRAKKAKWSIFGIDFFTWYSDPVEAVYPKPEPIPDKPEPIPVYSDEECIFNYCPNPSICKENGCINRQKKEEEPAPKLPEQKIIEVLVYFVNHNWALGNYIDINVNGVWYNLSELNHDSPEWTVKLWGSRGLIVEIPDSVKRISFKPSQIKFDGFDNNKAGFFSYKIGAKTEDYDLSNPTPNGIEDPNGWATWFRLHGSKDHEYAYLISGSGKIGGDESTTILATNIPEDWNRTGKMALILGNAGWNELPK